MERARILVVDDDPEIRKVLVGTLRRNGYAAVAAADGREALACFAAEMFQLVISDVKMPQMGGIDLLRGLKEKSPGTPVLLITGYGSVGGAVEAMQEGAADYLLKPFPMDALVLSVEKALQNANGNGNGAAASRKDKPTGAKPIVTSDPVMLALLQTAKNVAASKATILIEGESGTGKELLAAYIHANGAQRTGPYVAVNCAALPENLAESELFGHEKGAFTGAFNRKIGKFELAGSGTLVLDEIGEMPLALQAKLLRVLQEREIDRVGGKQPVAVDARVIAITNRELKTAVAEGRFRQDLYYRINVVPLKIPPLRQRRGDIPLLSTFFLERFCRRYQKNIMTVSDAARRMMKKANWPGNVRELENVLERAVLLSSGDVLQPEHLLLEDTPATALPTAVFQAGGLSLREMEKKLIFKALDEVNDNRTHAAQLLGISIRTLRNKLNQYKAENEQ